MLLIALKDILLIKPKTEYAEHWHVNSIGLNYTDVNIH